MNTTVRKNNVVPSSTISDERGLRTFSKWDEATRHGYRTSGGWKDMGFRLRKGEKAKAEIVTEIRSLSLYHQSQVSRMSDPQLAERLLIARFIKRYDLFGLRCLGTDVIVQRGSDTLRGSLKDLVYRSFNYKNRANGIRVPAIWPIRQTRAEGFYVRAGADTDWFVLDLDNHEPTCGSTDAHLQLLKRLVSLMPQLVARLGGGSVFYDYRQDAPRGIHIWVVMKRRRPTETLRKIVRTFLETNADSSLDHLLVRHGLKTMGELEILPSERLLIRLFGTYDRRVFTTEELKPIKERFNARSLLAHIRSETTDGDPCERYGDLARAGLVVEAPEEPPVTVAIDNRAVELTSEKPRRTSNFFTYLVDACLNGVGQADILFEAYLSPIARGLYFRDFHDLPRKREVLETTLMKWLETKHNGLVSRIQKNKRAKLHTVVRHIVRHMDDTPKDIQNYWASVRRNDVSNPSRVISLVACINVVLDERVEVTRENLPRVQNLLDSWGESDAGILKGKTYNRSIILPLPAFLPSSVEARLRDHLGKAGVRKGKCTERIIKFTRRLLHEIGSIGSCRIPASKIRKLAGLGQSPRQVIHYKKLLVGAGILKSGYKRTYKSQVLSSRYDLTEWVIREMKEAGY